MTNNEKILQAVLLDDKLMEFGGYTAEDIGNIYQSIDSDNYVISTVAQMQYRQLVRPIWQRKHSCTRDGVYHSILPTQYPARYDNTR